MNKNIIVGVLVVAVVGVLGFKMLSGGSGAKSPGTTGRGTTTLTIDGSNTMVQLVDSWAAAYMKEHPDTKITVNGQGSGTGIAALIQGTIDICSASRAMKSEEIAQAQTKNFAPKEYTVARDGIAVIVNPANHLREITVEQLKKIFTGTSTDWKQIGGMTGKIEVLSRESNSGTSQFFQEHIMSKEDYVPSAKMMSSTQSIVQTVTDDKSAIGYVGLGYADAAAGKVTVLTVKKTASSPAIAPSEATVIDGSYPISRPLFLYTPGEATGEAKAFIDFCASPAGQAIVEKTGYVRVGK